MAREIDSNSCDASLEVVLSTPGNALPCQALGDGSCLKDMLDEGGLQGIRLVWGDCLADVIDGVPRTKPSPLQKAIKPILDGATNREARDPEAAEVLRLFKMGVIAIAGAPKRTATALSEEIRTSEPKTNRFIAAIVDKVQKRLLTGLVSLPPNLVDAPQGQAIRKAVSGGSDVMAVMGLAVEPDNIIQLTEMRSVADNAQRENSQPTRWDALREVRGRLRKDYLGAAVLGDLIKEFERPGSKFKTPIFSSIPEEREMDGAFGVGMWYQAYLAVGVNAGLARPPRRR